MLFTTNESLDAWRRVLHDEDPAAAIVDRILGSTAPIVGRAPVTDRITP